MHTYIHTPTHKYVLISVIKPKKVVISSNMMLFPESEIHDI